MWISPLQYPADGRLRVLLITDKKTPVSDVFRPAVGCRVNGTWQLMDPRSWSMVPLPDTKRVYGWQEIAHEAVRNYSDEDLLTSLKTFVRCEHIGLVMAMDVIGWFHSVTASMVAELEALRRGEGKQ